jgi:SAM-dependent MidA family methyltransferase
VRLLAKSAPVRKQLNELRQIITSEIKAAGAIPFARFMDLALYCPVYGYYEKEKDTLGRRGDYYTSVSVGSLFGELLAFQFADWLIKCGVRSAECGITPAAARPRNRKETGTDYENEDDSPLHLVEAGAHGGELARDILTWLGEHRSALFERLQYWIIEPSPTAAYGKNKRWLN